jgi:hydroxypyruvate isomerase
LDGALKTLNTVGKDNLKVMFDCYHLQIMQGDLLKRIEAHMDHIGHIQFAAVPDRGEPDSGEVDFAWLLPQIEKLGWGGYFGAEYKPRESTDAGLSWMKRFS